MKSRLRGGLRAERAEADRPQATIDCRQRVKVWS